MNRTKTLEAIGETIRTLDCCGQGGTYNVREVLKDIHAQMVVMADKIDNLEASVRQIAEVVQP